MILYLNQQTALILLTFNTSECVRGNYKTLYMIYTLYTPRIFKKCD